MLSLGFSKAQLDIGTSRIVLAPDRQQPADEHRAPDHALREPVQLRASHPSGIVVRVLRSPHVEVRPHRLAERLHDRISAGLGAFSSPWSRQVAGRWPEPAWCKFGGGARGGGSLSPCSTPSSTRRATRIQTRISVLTRKPPIKKPRHQQLSVSRRVPFAVYVEYAGEDTSRGRNYLLGNSALSWAFISTSRRALRPDARGLGVAERLVRALRVAGRHVQRRAGHQQLVRRTARVG